MSFARCGMSLFIDNVVLPSILEGSGAVKLQRERSPFTIAREALMMLETCVNSLMQELCLKVSTYEGWEHIQKPDLELLENSPAS
jgi:hypothetical protein